MSSRPAASTPREPTVDDLGPVRRTCDVDPAEYPELSSLGGSLFLRYLPKPVAPTRPEYVVLRQPARDHMSFYGFVTEWNMSWEADHLRADLWDDRWQEVADILELQRLRRLVEAARVPAGFPDAGRPTANVQIVTQVGRSRLSGYMTLYQLLPLRTLERFGLPPLKGGLWLMDPPGNRQTARYYPADVEDRLARAFAHHVWPLLAPGARLGDLAGDEPLALLAHNLDFWVPYVDQVARQRLRDAADWARAEGLHDGFSTPMRGFGAPEEEAALAARIAEARDRLPDGYVLEPPIRGALLWRGEDDAMEATEEVVEAADAGGGLRALIDAVRAHRVEEDFAPRWSYAREDFERRLYRKRDKARVTFVELDDTVPVHGPASEYGAVTADGVPAAAAERLLWQDFFALLDPKERRIVVCLRNGATSLGDVARAMGYANHSPVSKALARIRQKAARRLDL